MRKITYLVLVVLLLLIANPRVVYAASNPWVQSNWIGGSGQTSWVDATKFSSFSNVDFSTANQISMSKTEKLTNTNFAVDLTGWSINTVPITTNLISFWGLNEATGNRADSVGTNTLASINSVGQSVGIVSNAAHFTAASSQYLNIASNASLQVGGTDFSFSSWVYMDSKSTLNDEYIDKQVGYKCYS